MALFAQGDVSFVFHLKIVRESSQEWRMVEYPYLVNLSFEVWRTMYCQL
jgi:hypothetical protein